MTLLLLSPVSTMSSISAGQIDRILILQPAKHSTQPVKAGEVRHWHTPMSAWELRWQWPWDLSLQHPPPSASQTRRPGATLEWGAAPQTWVGFSPHQGWRLTHSPWYLPVFPAQAVPGAKLKILLCLITRLLSGVGALGRFLKSNYSYYWLGFQKPSLFAECIHFQPFPSFFLTAPFCRWENVQMESDGERL